MKLDAFLPSKRTTFFALVLTPSIIVDVQNTQICRRINQTGHFYEDDIVELKAKQCEIWELLKQSQRAEL